MKITDYFAQKAKQLPSKTSNELEYDFYNLMKSNPREFHKMLIEEGIHVNSSEVFHWAQTVKTKIQEGVE